MVFLKRIYLFKNTYILIIQKIRLFGDLIIKTVSKTIDEKIKSSNGPTLYYTEKKSLCMMFSEV